MAKPKGIRFARRFGREVGESVGEIAKTMPSEILSADEAYENYQESETQSANYANNVLPELRRRAGCRDSGYGTYTVCTDNQVERCDELIDAFWGGVYDGIVKVMGAGRQTRLIPLEEFAAKSE